jgi:hypothetical protein
VQKSLFRKVSFAARLSLARLLCPLLLAFSTVFSHAQEHILTLAMARYEVPKKYRMEPTVFVAQKTSPAVRPKTISTPTLETPATANLDLTPSSFLEKRPFAESLNLFVRAGKNLHQEIRSNLHADLNFGYGQVFYERLAELDTHTGTRLQTPGCLYLKACFRF